MSSLAAYLNWDASRREREKLPLPEPDDMKTWKQLYKEVRAWLSVCVYNATVFLLKPQLRVVSLICYFQKTWIAVYM